MTVSKHMHKTEQLLLKLREWKKKTDKLVVRVTELEPDT